MSAPPPSVHVVVLTWNGWAETEECLDSLLRSSYRALRVTVVDNASTDGSVERFEAWRGGGTDGPAGGNAGASGSAGIAKDAPLRSRASFDLVRNQENLGFAEGNNRGIAHAMARGADFVFVLNNDTVVEPDAVARMVEAAQETGASMVAPAVFDYVRRDQVDRFGIVLTRSGSAYDRITADDGPLLCPSGCAALYRRDLVEALSGDPGGFFDRRFFIYSEDLDVGIRAAARGHRAVFAERSVIYHKGSAAWGLGSPRSYYLRHRNTIWTVAKGYSTGLLLREAPFLAAGQVLGLLNAIRRRRFRAVLKGKWEGVMGALRIRVGSSAPRLSARTPLDRRFVLHRRSRIADGASNQAGRRLEGRVGR